MSNAREAEVVSGSSLALLHKAEIDQQIATAHAFPRSVVKFKAEALEMATLDEETAASCFYSLPRGGKPIEGPSARLAEIVASAWGNLRYGAKVVEITQTQVVAEGFCHDLQRNNAARIEVRRSIVGKSGRYNDDMINVTGNAACSIALRNAIFKVVPMAYVKDVYVQARKVAIGDASTLSARRAKMLEHFGKMGVDQKRILWLLNRRGVEDISLEDMQTLIGLATAIKDGDTSVDEAFPSRDPNAPEPDKPKSKAEAKAAAAKKHEAPKSAPDATSTPAESADGASVDVGDAGESNESEHAEEVSPAPSVTAGDLLAIALDEAGFTKRAAAAKVLGCESGDVIMMINDELKPTADQLDKLEQANVDVRKLRGLLGFTPAAAGNGKRKLD